MSKKKFTETPIPLCGKEYYFKRCPTKTLTVYDERISSKADELRPINDESEALVDTVDRIESRIKNLEKKVELLDKKEEPSDKEIESNMKALDRIDDLYDELKTAKEEVRKFNEEHKSDYERIGNEMNEIMAEKVETMLDGITSDEFLETYDVVDMRIVTNLSKYYEMCIIGEKPSKIQNEIREDSRETKERMKSFRR